jgi:hypothetical protein
VTASIRNATVTNRRRSRTNVIPLQLSVGDGSDFATESVRESAARGGIRHQGGEYRSGRAKPPGKCQRLAAERLPSGRCRLVTFMDYELGYFVDETCRLEPIENPFRPKVIRMSPE